MKQKIIFLLTALLLNVIIGVDAQTLSTTLTPYPPYLNPRQANCLQRFLSIQHREKKNPKKEYGIRFSISLNSGSFFYQFPGFRMGINKFPSIVLKN